MKQRGEKGFDHVRKILDGENLLSGTTFDIESVVHTGYGKYTVTLARGEYHQADTTISFATLDAISRAFQTKKIDIDSLNRITGYCESCADSETVSQVTIFEAVL